LLVVLTFTNYNSILIESIESIFLLDILNVVKYSKKNMSDIMMYYIFPRQFGLRNVFTSESFDGLHYVYMDRKKESNVNAPII